MTKPKHPPMTLAEWPADRVAELVRLRAEGHSASVIGGLLGVTRNSVIGKCHRMKLAGHGPNNPPVIAAKPETGTAVRTGKSRGAHDKVNKARKAKKKPPASTKVVLFAHPPEPIPGKPLKLSAWAALPGSSPVKLVDYDQRSHRCKWPIDVPGEAIARFCNYPTENNVYCATHARRTRKVKEEA